MSFQLRVAEAAKERDRTYVIPTTMAHAVGWGGGISTLAEATACVGKDSSPSYVGFGMTSFPLNSAAQQLQGLFDTRVERGCVDININRTMGVGRI